MSLKASLLLQRGALARAGAERFALLRAIDAHGSISAAARACGLSYKGAWDAVQALNNLFDAPVIAAHPGGRSGGAAALTPQGRAVLAAMGHVQTELDAVAERLSRVLAGAPEDLAAAWSFPMRTSARNALAGVVARLTPGAVNTEVALAIGEGLEIVAVVTAESARELGLQPGRRAVALVKSSFVILAVGETAPRTSARNALAGTVQRIEEGAVSAEVVLAIGAGKTLTATVTRDSVEALGLAVGSPAWALVKAPHVILATD